MYLWLGMRTVSEKKAYGTISFLLWLLRYGSVWLMGKKDECKDIRTIVGVKHVRECCIDLQARKQSEMIANGVNGQIRVGETLPSDMKSKNQNVTKTQLMKLVIQQDYKCALTGWRLTPETASADHIVPIANGGLNAIENIQIVHFLVNRAKGTMENHEFVEMCCAVSSLQSSK
jgi:hypothetical protein